ncbi:DUF354 domain-containing protein [bacterium]|nr:DUF354 domain-containing protein [bacterium]
MKIWIDITNTPHVNVLIPIMKKLESEHELIISARDFSETLPLLRKNVIIPIVIGEYKGKSRIKKIIGMFSRMFALQFKIPRFDVSISLGGNYTAVVSKLRRKKSIIFSDNDISFKVPAYKYGSYFIFPTYFNSNNLEKKYSIKKEQIYKYNGFKEDIYIADYKPDKNFMNQLPFDEFITIRPENLNASYVPKDSITIVPSLFEKFKDENILFLPRYFKEREYAKSYDNIFIPDEPLSGLDVCYYTKAMLTGAGTFAREAALLGTPAVSFFSGKTFLTVDTIMQEKGWEFKSRDVDDIYDYVIEAQKRKSQQMKSKKVQDEVFSILNKII